MSGRSGTSTRLPTLGAVTAAIVLFVAGPRAAHAVYQCDGYTDDCQCGMNNPYPCCDNGGGNYGNCTWWGWHRACCDWVVGLPGWGNANTWAPNAQAHADYNVVASPVVNSIACSNQGTYGHVAWVTAVNGGQITVTEMNCCSGCNDGARSWTYNASWFNQGFIVRATCDCSPGDTDTRSCGNCGTESRTCEADCHWGPWSGCTGEGPCTDGQTETATCGDCGEHTRTCQADCQWGPWSACDGPDPQGGTLPCDTGLDGVCSEGIQRCVAGYLECEQTTASSPESCDALDNDCDGQTDEDDVCSGSDAGPRPDGAQNGSDASEPPLPDASSDGSPGGPDALVPGPGARDVVGGCTCRAAERRHPRRAPLLPVLLLALVCALLGPRLQGPRRP